MASELRCRLARWGCGTLLLLVLALPYVVRLDPRNNHPPVIALAPPPAKDRSWTAVGTSSRAKTRSWTAVGTSSGGKEHNLSAVGASPGGWQQDDREVPDQCGEPVRQPSRQPVSDYDLTRIGPLKFRKDYKNPCWVAKDRQTRCLPYFYLAGFPKCGTTDLYRRLVAHPDIMAKGKEPHWITRKRFGSSQRVPFTNYTRSFAPRDTVRNVQRYIAGDGSASTAWDNHLWPLFPGNENCSEPNVITADYIRHLNPRAKIIMLLRNPTQRLYSGFMYFRHTVLGDRTQQEEFHEKVVHTIAIFNRCRKTHSLRNCAYDDTLFETTNSSRIHIGIYSVFLEDWLLRFPRDQVIVMRLEDPRMERQMRRVFRFLGVELPDPDTMRQIVNKTPANVGKKKKENGLMLEKTRKLLDRFYRPFNHRLADILGDRKYLWEDPH